MRKNVWMGMIVLVACPLVSGAGFDCSKASTSIEKMICSDKQLSELDDALADAYRKAASGSDPVGIKARQRLWISEERNKCQDSPCLKRAYSKRLAELTSTKGGIAGKETTIIGRVEWGQGTSSIVPESGPSIDFDSKSDMASKIFKACQVNDLCEVVGTVDSNEVIMAVTRVRKLRAAAQTSQGTPQPQPLPQAKASGDAKISDGRKGEALTIDYTLVVQGIGGTQKKDRPAAGSIRKITLDAYLNWERKASEEWKFALWNASGIANKNVVYNDCLQKVEDQWTTSFGYRETVLRSPEFINGQIDLGKVLRIVCSPG